MFKYFTITSNSTIDDIKKQYKKLAFKYHPDVGGSNEAMQEVNAEYEKALVEVGKMHNKNYSMDVDFINIIDALIKLKIQNVVIEICGWFIYITGNTKPYKDSLKSLGLFWNNNKKCWYYKPVWYRKIDREFWSMDKIRSTWGSQIINNNNSENELSPALV